MPCLIVTSGEPAGIGPDLILIHAMQPHAFAYVVIADINLLQQRAEQLGLSINILPYENNARPDKHTAGQLHVLHTPLKSNCVSGQLNPDNAQYVLNTLDIAIEKCQSGEFSAMVTAPISKAVINESGIAFSGHTEYLASKTKAKQPLMMLATPGLRVVLATTHVPLREVNKHITKEHIKNCIELLHDELVEHFNISNPRIKVCGLNPHAGEDGHIGKEDQQIIQPVIESFQKQGYQVEGPVSADTAFTSDKMQQTDAYLTMFHDQGLPVLKHIGFNRAVNITLGLPVIRTSVDHGTALELAGTGNIKTGSFNYALECAEQLCGNHR